jgi:hypothetical protein
MVKENGLADGIKSNEMPSFAERVIAFNKKLKFEGKLPKGISIMNPFRENPEIIDIAKQFYTKFYNDTKTRTLILGINPGRLGAGATGIPFTDTKRLSSECGIEVKSVSNHEPSSVFVYDMITAYGGPKKFYSKFYIHSVCPLGFTETNARGKEVNHNYYDSKELMIAVLPFIKWNILQQIKMGCRTDLCYCLGTGKNFDFLSRLNEEEKYFEKIVPLEHPRFVVQYKAKEKDKYIAGYLKKLR